ncbi:hypothetical protein JZ751_003115 [Albula glossodonta]|uniref:Galectin n=1 Tax=Albula glossodonta TaxID=121402 RepID=A0A8T2NK19_9TELE|nr:hypothetical protein JZ751_003115 [Albula glossodonta]
MQSNLDNAVSHGVAAFAEYLDRVCSWKSVGTGAQSGDCAVLKTLTLLCAHSMVVALVCQPQDDAESDVGLQVTVSFPERAVLRNARLGGKWGVSENALSYFPFAAGEPFKMEIVCEHQQFRMLVDGQPLCCFTHRLTQLSSLTALHIYGDLQLTKVA